MNRRDLLTAGAAIAGARSIDKATAWIFLELDEHERYAVWLASGYYDRTPIDDETYARIPGLIRRGHLVEVPVPDGHWLRDDGLTSMVMATAKGKRTLDRMGFASKRET